MFDLAQWVAGGTMFFAAVGWFVKLERSMNNRLTRAEHDAICMRRNEEIKDKLDVIRDDIREIRTIILKE